MNYCIYSSLIIPASFDKSLHSQNKGATNFISLNISRPKEFLRNPGNKNVASVELGWLRLEDLLAP